MKFVTIGISSLLSTVFYLALFAGGARAEGGGGVVISPPFQEVIVADAQSTTLGITLTNRTKTNQSISATTIDFESLDESGGVAFLGSEINDLERKYGLANWLKLDAAQTTLPAGGSKKIMVSLENRPDLSPGGHYGAVIFKIEGPPAAGSPNSVAVKQVLASLIFAKKRGGERYDLKLASMHPPSKWTGGNQKVKLRFYNPGNVHLVPRGVLRLEDSRGKLISKSVINSDSGILLPEAYRQYLVTLADVPILKPGKYRLEAEYRYDGIEQTITFTKQITIFDWRFAVFLGAWASVIIIPVIALIIFLLRRQRRKKKRRKHHAAF